MALSDFLETEPPTAKEFVQQGYLPENLPPVFTTRELWKPFEDASSRYLVSQTRQGQPANYNASKRGEQRRIFSLPHPLFQRDAGLFFEKNWQLIQRHCEQSTGSASKPQKPNGRHRAVTITPQSQLASLRLTTLASQKFCLITDVARCFPSIYTHTIPWALDGKSKAKKDRRENSPDVIGNRIDFIFRQGQDGQTSGIPVGPDTSRIASEIVLAKVDKQFLENSRKKPRYIRHVDDYWIGGDSAEECERHLTRLREGLAAYQLDINESKTQIVPLSEVIGEYWPTELTKEIQEHFAFQYSWSAKKSSSKADITAFFARVIDLVNRTRDDAILKFFVRQIDKLGGWHSHWELLEPFLAHCCIQYPHCFDYVVRVLVWRLYRDEEIDRKLWREVLGKLCYRASGFGRDAELLWGLWLYKEMDLRVPSKIVNQLLKTNGPLVLAYAAHLAAHGHINQKNWFSDLNDRAAGEHQFSGHLWPLSLELFHLEESKGLAQVQNPDGSWLSKPHELRVSTIDFDAKPHVFYDDNDDDKDDSRHDDEFIPDHAIEDFTSNYDDEDDSDDDEFDAFDDLVF